MSDKDSFVDEAKAIWQDFTSQHIFAAGGELALIVDGEGNPDWRRTMQTMYQSIANKEGTVKPLYFRSDEVGAVAAGDITIWEKTDKVTPEERRVIDGAKEVFSQSKGQRGDVAAKLIGAGLDAIVPG